MNTSALTSPSLFFRRFALTALILSGTVLALSGCAIDSITPDSAATATAASSVPTAPMAAIQGSDYGGHAPIVSAKVFVLEPNPAATGYGQIVKSLIPANTTGASQDTTAGSPTYGMWYVPTSSSGQLFITGDYTCDIGYPVYLYAAGGNPQAQTVNQGAIQLTGASSSITTPGYVGTLVVTFTVKTPPSLLYQGESITFNTFSDPIYGGFSNYTGTVASVNLSTSQFSIVLGSSTTAPASSTFSGYVTVSQASNPSNPAIANMAMLGVCGDTSPTNPTVTTTTNFSNLNFVYVNEVSTVATAYALSGFFNTTANDDALHISVPSSDAQALVGLQNAARNAALLYDIQGGNVGSGSDGDTHIARSTTSGVSSYIGAATVPQAMLNTLGNILANCVDSANTYNAAFAASGTASPQCTGSASSGLFYNTRADGTTTGTGTNNIPNDTATAAINIAHNPGSNTTALINNITGNVPFYPNLTSANDFTVGLTFHNSGAGSGDISISASPDKNGNIWVTGFEPGGLYEFSPQAALLNSNLASEQGTYDLAFDSSGNVYTTQNEAQPIANGYGFYGYPPGSGAATVYGNSAEYLTPYGIAIDASDNIYIAQVGDGDPGPPPASIDTTIYEFTKASGYNISNVAKVTSGCGGGAEEIALDGVGNLWGASDRPGGNPPITPNATLEVCRFKLSNSTETDFTGLSSPGFIAIDSSNSAWITDTAATAGTGLFKFTSTATSTPASYTGGGLNKPFGVAIDGAGNVIVANAGNNTVSVFNSAGTALSPSTGYSGITSATTSSYINTARTVAVDPSGNVWIPGRVVGSPITEIIGLATPVITPLSNALKQGKIASMP